jgi:hypothetical protein
MLANLQTHPFAVEAHLKRVLALTYALPESELAASIPRALTLDTYDGWGFVAVALVETENLRPAFLPAVLGTNFYLAGYRVFVRLRARDGRNLRGLYILRSFTDRRRMEWGGNLFTRYRYQRCSMEMNEREEQLCVNVVSPGGEADLRMAAWLRPLADLSPTVPPPPGPIFPDAKTARRFCGPLPYTFSVENEGRAALLVEGVRGAWNPQAVAVDVERNTFRIDGSGPRLEDCKLASAFFVRDVPYRWKKGVRVLLPENVA